MDIKLIFVLCVLCVVGCRATYDEDKFDEPIDCSIVNIATQPVESPIEFIEGNDSDITVQFNEISQQKKPFFRLSVSDNNFSFTVDDKGVPSFKKENSHMTLDDLVDFVKVRCLDEILYPKMARGEPISQDEALLLTFALDAQATMIKAIGVAMAWDIYGLGGEYKTQMPSNGDINELAKRESDIFAPLIDEFVNSNGGFRHKIRIYGNNFLGVRTSVKRELFSNISIKGKLFEDNKPTPEFSKVVKTHPWLIGSAVVGFGVCGGSLAYVAAQKNMQHISLSEYEKAALSVCTYGNVGQEWLDLWVTSQEYLKEYWDTYNRVKAYYTNTRLKGDAGLRARQFAKRIYQYSVPMTNLILNDYCIQFYDFPFILLTMKARGEYRQCKGFWNDNEQKMKEVMMRYGETISGTDMLSHLNSTYAIDAYADLLEMFKSDIDFMFDGNFKRFQAATRIREFAREKTRKDIETGLDTNGFKGMGE